MQGRDLLFKSRRSLYRKRRRRFNLLTMLAGIVLSLMIVELLARLLVAAVGKINEIATYKGAPRDFTVYRPKFLDQTQQLYDGLPDLGDLAVQRDLAVGYSLLGKQQSDFWRINEQGFRDDDPVPLVKPKNEIRIFLLGGSTAFGQGNANNQVTIASYLEARLNQRIKQQRRSPQKYRPMTLPPSEPELKQALALPPKIRNGKYRVINAAVPGYTSGNALAQLALKILPYSPDAVIVLGGYTDLITPSDQNLTDIPNTEAFLQNATGHFWTHLTQQLKHLVTKTYLAKAITYWVFDPQPSVSQRSLVVRGEVMPLKKYLPQKSDELERRLTRYRNNLRHMLRLTAGQGIPLLVAVQPEITGRGNKTIKPAEKEILQQLGKVYQKQVQANYPKLVVAGQQLEKGFPKNIKVLNLYTIYQNFPELAFNDAIHLTEAANIEVAKSLYYGLTSLPKLQVASFYSNIDK
ncbi:MULTISPECIES: SGNH/GDSL hydrolase family protein [unclassified Moorena]|uniref:SGNH/GDSL hydrolase family protein n=1 Tax=unclassified Moorena TaxID=2683338 RepID=UPI0025FC80B0|nr:MULTISPECIES: SGNH/GDSL hydrolase family protein [unclassified Moorena]